MTVMDRKCDQPNTTTDDYLDELRRTMQEHGWAVQYVESDRIPFAYTVGPVSYTHLTLPTILLV